MEIREYTRFNRGEILALYSSVGWTNYTDNPDRLERAYENSLVKIGAFDDGRLIGVIRAVGDGETILFVQDILVYPEYQRMGIGTTLMRAVMEQYASVYQFELLTDNTEKTVRFYQLLGLVKAEEIGCCAFIKM